MRQQHGKQTRALIEKTKREALKYFGPRMLLTEVRAKMQNTAKNFRRTRTHARARAHTHTHKIKLIDWIIVEVKRDIYMCNYSREARKVKRVKYYVTYYEFLLISLSVRWLL